MGLKKILLVFIMLMLKKNYDFSYDFRFLKEKSEQ